MFNIHRNSKFFSEAVLSKNICVLNHHLCFVLQVIKSWTQRKSLPRITLLEIPQRHTVHITKTSFIFSLFNIISQSFLQCIKIQLCLMWPMKKQSADQYWSLKHFSITTASFIRISPCNNPQSYSCFQTNKCPDKYTDGSRCHARC